MNPVRVIVQMRWTPESGLFPDERLPPTAVIGFHVTPTRWTELVWDSVWAARQYAADEGAVFESQLDKKGN